MLSQCAKRGRRPALLLWLVPWGPSCVAAPSATSGGVDDAALRAGPDGSARHPDAPPGPPPESEDDVGFAPKLAPLRADLACGERHSCAVVDGGELACWGGNGSGQVGDGTTEDRFLPVRVAGLRDVVHVSLGDRHSCAVTLAGRLYCWGGNGSGEIGDGSTTDRAVPTLVQSLERVVKAASGDYHTCALDDMGEVYCWGSNRYGQLGTGDLEDRATPVRVARLGSISDIDAGGWMTGGAHACALGSAPDVYCWGRNEHGQLGDGTTTDRTEPVAVSGVSRIVQIALGSAHTCAVADTGALSCWGRNNAGQAGDDTLQDRLVPAPVFQGLGRVLRAGPGGAYTCALLFGGSVVCWGNNVAGQIGDGTLDGQRWKPTAVALPESVGDMVALAVGRVHNCARSSIGEVWCWGDNFYGSLGDGGVGRGHLPVRADL